MMKTKQDFNLLNNTVQKRIRNINGTIMKFDIQQHFMTAAKQRILG